MVKVDNKDHNHFYSTISIFHRIVPDSHAAIESPSHSIDSSFTNSFTDTFFWLSSPIWSSRIGFPVATLVSELGRITYAHSYMNINVQRPALYETIR